MAKADRPFNKLKGIAKKTDDFAIEHNRRPFMFSMTFADGSTMSSEGSVKPERCRRMADENWLPTLLTQAADRLEALYNALTGLAAVTFPNINFHPDDVKEAWEAAQEVIFAGRDDSDEAPITELIRPFIKRAAEAATATGSADRLEELRKALDDLNRVTNPLLIHSDREIHRARVAAQKALGMDK